MYKVWNLFLAEEGQLVNRVFGSFELPLLEASLLELIILFVSADARLDAIV